MALVSSSFVSWAFRLDIQVTDIITEHCDLLDLLESENSVMADKRFDIHELVTRPTQGLSHTLFC